MRKYRRPFDGRNGFAFEVYRCATLRLDPPDSSPFASNSVVSDISYQDQMEDNGQDDEVIEVSEVSSVSSADLDDDDESSSENEMDEDSEEDDDL